MDRIRRPDAGRDAIHGRQFVVFRNEPHGYCDLGLRGICEFDERQAHPRRRQSEQAQGVFERGGRVIARKRSGEAADPHRKPSGNLQIALLAASIQLLADIRNDVRRDRDAAVSTVDQECRGGRIVA